MASLMNENNNSQSWSNNSSGIQENNNENENTAMNDSNDDNNNNNNDNVTNTQQPVRKRTRATADQLSVLEDTFAVNVSPNSKLRKQLAEQLQMSERSIQIWFQNRRAKVKHMQKRAQMQMHQASIRAQLYQYHQQQQQQGYAQPMNYYYNPVTAVNYHHHHPSRILNAIPRAQSVDAIQHYHRQQQLFVPPPPPPPGISPSNYNPTMFYPAMDMSPISRQSMPPYDLNDIGLEFPEYLNGPSPSPSPIQPMKPSTIPTLIPVPDAGPTAVLATTTTTTTTTNTNTNTTTKINNKNNDIANKRTSSVEDTWISSPDSSNNNDDKNNKNATSTDSSTVDPSNLVITGKEQSTIVIEGDEEEEPKDLYLSATTLTIGTWHRLRMSETDLVCVYRPDTRTFAWHIVDGGCHFKMEVTQDAVSSIEYIVNGEHDALAEVHFDISEPPLFYMESTTVNTTIEEDPQDKKKRKASNASIITPVWVQCSDFTEGKQASRFFRHTLKGVQHHLKQELLALIQNHEETRRLVHFIEPPAPSAATAAAAANIYPMDYSTDITGYLNPGVYWNNGGGIPITTSAGNTNGGTSSNNDLLSCGLYIS